MNGINTHERKIEYKQALEVKRGKNAQWEKVRKQMMMRWNEADQLFEDTLWES